MRPVLTGIGIDILNLSKVKRLLRPPSQKKILHLFTPLERKKLSGKKSVRWAARFLAAKEAFFKASNLNWMSPDTFKDIEVRCSQGSLFQVKSLARLQSSVGQGCFFERDHFVGAQVVVWKQV